jgi:SAM-dependent methyltransferase
MIKNSLYTLIGRSSLVLDRLRKPRVPVASNGADAERFDRTGLVAGDSHDLKVLYDRDPIIFVEHDSLAHSFWRAQELSLFRKYRHLIVSPSLDFGCGDASFASMVFKNADYGVDHDPEALAVAKKFNVYGQLVLSSEKSIPLPDESVMTIFSNSVLEHVSDLNAIVKEWHRVLKPGGRILFTVPTAQLRIDLAKYFGQKESDRINLEYWHRNLLTEQQWSELLHKTGFEVKSIHPYQPDWFTFWYRMYRFFGNRGLGRFIPNIRQRVWTLFHKKIVRMIEESISTQAPGSNIFVFAEKPAR